MPTSYSRPIVAALFLLCLSITALVLSGWVFHAPTLTLGLGDGASMKANTAIGLAALGASGLLLRWERVFPWRIPSALALASFAGLLSVVCALEGIFHVDLRIDELLFLDPASVGTRWHPGRPSPVSILNLFLLSCSIILTETRRDFFRDCAQAFRLLVCVISYQSVVSYFEGTNAKFGLAVYSQMSLHTALSFAFLSTGFLLLRPRESVAQIAFGRTQASRVGRALLFFAIVAPPSISIVQGWGERNGVWDTEFGTLFRIVAQVTFFAFVAIKTGVALLTSEAKDSAAAESLRLAINARDEFLSIASHELRTPVTSMKLQAQITERSLASAQPAEFQLARMAKMVRQTNESVIRLEHLLNEMFDISKIDRGRLDLNLAHTSVTELVRESVDRFQLRFAEAGITVSVQAAGAFAAEIDRFRIDQVLTNLFANAARYAPGKPLTVRLLEAGEFLRFEVIDGGPGIAECNRTRIFQRFERVDPTLNSGGLGLGLYIARSIVEAHEGSIRVESNDAGGARFVVELPRSYTVAVGSSAVSI